MSKPRKKGKPFKETKVGGWLTENAPNILEGIGEAVPGASLLETIGQALKGDPKITPAQELEYYRLTAEYHASEFEAVSSRWESDLGSRYALPQLVRPIVLLALTTAIITFAAIDASEALRFDMSPQWIDMLTTLGTGVFVAYFGGRSIEKTWKK